MEVLTPFVYSLMFYLKKIQSAHAPPSPLSPSSLLLPPSVFSGNHNHHLRQSSNDNPLQLNIVNGKGKVETSELTTTEISRGKKSNLILIDFDIYLSWCLIWICNYITRHPPQTFNYFTYTSKKENLLLEETCSYGIYRRLSLQNI